MADGAAFTPTHVAPEAGLRTWATADTSQPTAGIPSRLEVELAERRGDWARIVCSNGWLAWVDGRELIDIAATPSIDETLTESSDPVVRELAGALTTCQKVLEEYRAGSIDDATLRHRLFRAGLIVHDDDAWLLDISAGKWFHYNGFLRALTNGSHEA